MSDASQGPGWWIASDGKWYPPQEPAGSVATAPQPPLPSPTHAGGSNGMAVAALIFGLSAFVCLGPLGGILAIIFGFAGLGKAKVVGTGKGMSTAGIILGAVGTAASILVVVALILGAGKAANDFSGTADPNTYTLTTDANTCASDGFGFITFQGSITNTTTTKKNFTVNTEIRDSANNVVLQTLPDIVSDINPGDSAQWKVVAPIDDSVLASCQVISVENFLN